MNLLKRKIYTITGMADIIRICTLITIRQAHLQATVSSATFTWSPGLNCQCPGSCCNWVDRGDRQCSSCSSPISRLKTEHGLILKYVLEMNYCNLMWLSDLHCHVHWIMPSLYQEWPMTKYLTLGYSG